MDKYENPYHNCAEKGDSHKVGAVIPRSIYAFLKGIRPEDGTIQTTINLLIKRLVDELKGRNITAFTDRDKFEYFVANCRFSLYEQSVDYSLSPVAGTDTYLKRTTVGIVRDTASSTPLRRVEEEGRRVEKPLTERADATRVPSQGGHGGRKTGKA